MDDQKSSSCYKPFLWSKHTHFKNNRIYYQSLHDTDPTFLTQVYTPLTELFRFNGYLAVKTQTDAQST